MKTMPLSSNLKSIIRAVPFLGDFLSSTQKKILGDNFETSAKYWEERYQKGDNSGPGSYGRLAEYKAEIINNFLEEFSVESLIEFGCGDGAQLELLDTKHYLGVDVSKTVIEQARAIFSEDETKSFITLDAFNDAPEQHHTALSLDVIYHLTEDEVFEDYMSLLFASAKEYVVIYSSNKDMKTSDSHVRHREFTNWINEHAKPWRLIHKGENPHAFDWKNPRNTSFAEFYFYQRFQGSTGEQ